MTTDYILLALAAWLAGDAIYVASIVIRWGDQGYPSHMFPVELAILRGLAWPVWLLILIALCVWFLIACVIDLFTGSWRTWFKKGA